MRDIYRLIFRHWRVKRYAQFVAKLEPQAEETIVDVGGTPITWVGHGLHVRRIDCVNVLTYPVPVHSERFELRYIPGNGCAMTCADHSYDIVYSNSVIEHVGHWEDQVAFAREVRRIARRVWVQSPALECPIEPHFLALFVHWLPIRLRRFFVQYFTLWGWLSGMNRVKTEEMVHEIRLLSRAEFAQLFPDCEIITERFLGIFPKSYIAVRL